ncbi:hypothetical protein HK098_002181 [Nowakowskiella sp. JEL0407]|nr:hypothetical protein HK098_002181 [Nowakowskiella sp. JEL0407]
MEKKRVDSYSTTSKAVKKPEKNDGNPSVTSFWDNFVTETTGGWKILHTQSLRLEETSSVITAPLPTDMTERRSSISSLETVVERKTDTDMNTLPRTNDAANTATGLKVNTSKLISPTMLYKSHVTPSKRISKILKVRKSIVVPTGFNEYEVAKLIRNDPVGFGFVVIIEKGENVSLEFVESERKDGGDWSVEMTCLKNGKLEPGVMLKLQVLKSENKAGLVESILECKLQIEEGKFALEIEEILIAAISGYLMLGVEDIAFREIRKRELTIILANQKSKEWFRFSARHSRSTSEPQGYSMDSTGRKSSSISPLPVKNTGSLSSRGTMSGANFPKQKNLEVGVLIGEDTTTTYEQYQIPNASNQRNVAWSVASFSSSRKSMIRFEGMERSDSPNDGDSFNSSYFYRPFSHRISHVSDRRRSSIGHQKHVEYKNDQPHHQQQNQETRSSHFRRTSISSPTELSTQPKEHRRLRSRSSDAALVRTSLSIPESRSTTPLPSEQLFPEEQQSILLPTTPMTTSASSPLETQTIAEEVPSALASERPESFTSSVSSLQNQSIYTHNSTTTSLRTIYPNSVHSTSMYMQSVHIPGHQPSQRTNAQSPVPFAQSSTSTGGRVHRTPTIDGASVHTALSFGDSTADNISMFSRFSR